MSVIDLSNPIGEGFPQLKNGMAWMLYTDTGPTGICGQSVSITCPYTRLHLWPSEDAMRSDLEGKDQSSLGRKGRQARIEWGVIGEFSTGNAAIVIHE